MGEPSERDLSVDVVSAAFGRLAPRLRDLAVEAAGVHCSGSFTVSVCDDSHVRVLDASGDEPLAIGSINYLPLHLVVTARHLDVTLLSDSIERDDTVPQMQAAVDMILKAHRGGLG